VVDELHENAKALVGVDTHTLTDDELGDALVGLHRVEALLAAAKARLTDAFDVRRAWSHDGSKSAAAWLTHRCHTSRQAMQAQTRTARRLRAMPLTAAALRAGEIDDEHVQVLARVAGAARLAVSGAFPKAEEQLVDFAKTLSFDDFVRAVRYWEQVVDPDGVENDAADDHAARYFHALTTFRDNIVLNGQLDPVAGAEFVTALERIETDLFKADWAEAKALHGDDTRAGHLARNPGQRRADALVEMARRAMAAPADARKPEPLITVLVDYDTFAGRVCELLNGTVITPGQLAGLLTQADIERVVFDPKSRVLDVGHRNRLFTGALRHAIAIRDQHCTHHSCDTPADHCHIDHIQPWATGGNTTQDNGRLKCASHNRWAWNHEQRHGPDPPDTG